MHTIDAGCHAIIESLSNAAAVITRSQHLVSIMPSRYGFIEPVCSAKYRALIILFVSMRLRGDPVWIVLQPREI